MLTRKNLHDNVSSEWKVVGYHAYLWPAGDKEGLKSVMISIYLVLIFCFR